MKRKNQPLDETLARSMRNPFSALDFAPWTQPDFDETTARRVWRAVKEGLLAHWQSRYPLKRPWPVWILDLKVGHVPVNAKQADLLKKHGLLTPHEATLLARRSAND